MATFYWRVKPGPDVLLSVAMGTAGATKPSDWVSSGAAALAAILAGISIVTSCNAAMASNATNQSVAEFQAGAESDRSRAEYLRAQRREAYAEFLSVESEYRTLMWELVDTSNGGRIKPPPADGEWWDRWRPASEDLRLNVSTIRLLGPESVITPMLAIEDKYRMILSETLVTKNPNNPAVTPPADAQDIAIAPITLEQDALEVLRESFIAEAQKVVQGG